jgi:hypothetical protein
MPGPDALAPWAHAPGERHGPRRGHRGLRDRHRPDPGPRRQGDHGLARGRGRDLARRRDSPVALRHQRSRASCSGMGSTGSPWAIAACAASTSVYPEILDLRSPRTSTTSASTKRPRSTPGMPASVRRRPRGFARSHPARARSTTARNACRGADFASTVATMTGPRPVASVSIHATSGRLRRRPGSEGRARIETARGETRGDPRRRTAARRPHCYLGPEIPRHQTESWVDRVERDGLH